MNRLGSLDICLVWQTWNNGSINIQMGYTLWYTRDFIDGYGSYSRLTAVHTQSGAVHHRPCAHRRRLLRIFNRADLSTRHHVLGNFLLRPGGGAEV